MITLHLRVCQENVQNCMDLAWSLCEPRSLATLGIVYLRLHNSLQESDSYMTELVKFLKVKAFPGILSFKSGEYNYSSCYQESFRHFLCPFSKIRHTPSIKGRNSSVHKNFHVDSFQYSTADSVVTVCFIFPCSTLCKVPLPISTDILHLFTKFHF